MDPFQVAAWWIGAFSVLAFLTAVVDKRRAGTGRRRVPERTLLFLALLGGTLGLVAAMLLARHKTSKTSFLLRLALVVVLQAVVVYLLVRP